MPTDLSLGKLRRATDPANVDVNNTANSKLAEDAAGTTSDNSDVAMSAFAIDAVAMSASNSGLKGFKFVDESTTTHGYEVVFTNEGARFDRIKKHPQNFAWAKQGSITITGGQNSGSGLTAGAISNVDTANTVGDGVRGTFHEAHTGDFLVSVTASFREDGQSDGYNSAIGTAGRYNMQVSKSVSVEDVYNGTAIACFTPDTPIFMWDGTEKNIEDILIGDKVKSLELEGMTSLEWVSEDMKANIKEAEVENMFFDFADEYLLVNDRIKVTSEHPMLVNREGVFQWKPAGELQEKDLLVDSNLSFEEITSIEQKEEEIEIVNIDVSGTNIYFAGKSVVHNKGSNAFIHGTPT